MRFINSRHERPASSKIRVFVEETSESVVGANQLANVRWSAVFDGVGRDTFVECLDCVRPFGMLVNYGNASGHPPPIDLLQLAKRGSLSICRPALSSFTADVTTMRAAAAELFELVERGILKIEISRTYALHDAANAHRDIENRKSASSMLLLP